MKSSLEQEEALSTTTEGENISNPQLKEKSYLFNHIDNLAAGHNVSVSNTMIKVTYKKALKDHYVSLYDTRVDTSSCLVLSESNMNVSEVCKRKTGETVNLCNSDSPLVPSNLKSHMLAKAGSTFHSTPKQQAVAEKKREYVNGLNLTLKQAKCKSDSIVSPSEVQNMVASKSSDSLNPRIKSLNTGRSTNLRFLKDIRVVKVKDSIINKNSGVGKVKKPQVEMKKVENGVKNRTEAALGKHKKLEVVRRNVVTRKIKSSENKSKGGENSNKKVEDNKSGGNKKAIMLVDPELPSGWTRFIRTKNKGSASEQHVVYVVSPQGKKFRFKWKLRKFLQRTNSSLDADQFFFGLYKRPKSSYVPASERNENRAESKSRKNSVLHISSKNASFHKVPVKGSIKTLGASERRILSDSKGQVSNAEVVKSPGKVLGADGRELLLFDPDLPFGWKRIIHSNSSNGRLQVHIISPEGRIFRRRYRLSEYLTKHQYTHNLDRFYFGLYPKKEGSGAENSSRESEEGKVLHESSDENNEGGEDYSTNSENEDDSNDFIVSEAGMPTTPMYDDPNLPEGWKRFIKIRSCGESAGRMEVVIVSPDGRKHRSKGHLEQYLQQQNLDYKADDFNFTVFGKSGGGKKRSSVPEPKDFTFGVKKKFTDKPVQPLDIDSLKDVRITSEGEMINTVTGLMMSCGLTSVRAERRLRVPRSAHEKSLRNHLDAEGEVSNEGCQIPTYWIERLVKCRSDFRMLEQDAVSTIAERTKEFIKELSLRALIKSENPEDGLRYDDVAEVVNGSECLSPLQTLIPKKISYREYIRLNRPKQFMSFT